MVNYEQGKIYRIVCNTTGLQYIGSTTKKTIAMRLSHHKSSYKLFQRGEGNYMSSYQILDGNNYEIILIENFPCQSKDELHARERFYIETTPCVNMVIPTRTEKEYYVANKDKIAEKNRRYREANKNKLAEYQRQYHEANRDNILERQHQYYEAKRDKLAEHNRIYYQTNRERILEYRRQYKQRSQSI